MATEVEVGMARTSRQGAEASVLGRAAMGRDMRERLPRSSHGEWERTAEHPSPLEILAAQERTRVAELLPIRHGRMASSPFAFFRGAAAVMASDLAAFPHSGLKVQLCGDAHLMNFGGFADPSRTLVFDLNDFDETHPGPFEWDVKRLAASLEIAARERGLSKKQRRSVVLRGIGRYRSAIGEFASMRWFDIWNSRLDMGTVERRWGQVAGQDTLQRFHRRAQRAPSKDHLRAFSKLTTETPTGVQFLSDPPLLQPVSELVPEDDAHRLEDIVGGALRAYRETLPHSRRQLLDRYRFVDLARKVVGVGSVGTRCWVALLLGRDIGDPLFLQVKEAEASVLSTFLGPGLYDHQGRRVVEGQELMQAASDVLLGWHRTAGVDDVPRDFYIRQLWDWKTSAELDAMTPEILAIYAEMCGWTLARAHARSGDPVVIAGYLGSSDRFDQAMVAFATAYADQNEIDHRALVEAVRAGELEATEGV